MVAADGHCTSRIIVHLGAQMQLAARPVLGRVANPLTRRPRKYAMADMAGCSSWTIAYPHRNVPDSRAAEGDCTPGFRVLQLGARVSQLVLPVLSFVSPLRRPESPPSRGGSSGPRRDDRVRAPGVAPFGSGATGCTDEARGRANVFPHFSRNARLRKPDACPLRPDASVLKGEASVPSPDAGVRRVDARPRRCVFRCPAA